MLMLFLHTRVDAIIQFIFLSVIDKYNRSGPETFLYRDNFKNPLKIGIEPTEWNSNKPYFREDHNETAKTKRIYVFSAHRNLIPK